jgi:putative methyltransferase (TIGR04325 family)
MTALRWIRALAREAERVPLLRRPLELVYAHRFNRAAGQTRIFRGVYADFTSAARDIPSYRLQGYDNEESALRLERERLRICPFDYPIMFWLLKLLAECRVLFDFGGHVGISYFGYQRYLGYPPGLKWLVYDLPAITRAGERIARQESAPGLCFTTSLEELPTADILLCGGSLQFVEDPFALLRSLSALPRHILVNKLPVYSRPAAATVHNFGSALCAYHLFNRADVVGNFEALGYRLADEWKTPDLGCAIPFHRDHSIQAYSGFYFTNS